jgi:glycosyltransferase involved in cell wall biosynthesis
MSINRPRVLVGVPTYNRAERLKRTIRSVQESTYPNIAILIADNASTDDTPVVARELARLDPRIRYVRHLKNHGPVANLKYCWDQCVDPYFMWVADDDVVDPSYLAECIEALEGDPSLVLASGIRVYRRSDGSLSPGVPTSLLDPRPWVRVLQYFRHAGDNGVFYGVYRHTALGSCELRGRLGNDWLWLAEVATVGRVRTLDSARLTREDSWSAAGSRTEYFRRVAELLALPRFIAYVPTAAIGVGVAHGIALDSRAFARMPRVQRIAVAVAAAGMVTVRGAYSRIREWFSPRRNKAS